MSNPKTQSALVKLDYPVQLPDRRLAEVVVRRPTLGDLMDFPVDAASGLKEEVALLAHLCGLNVEDMRALDSEDYGKVQEQVLRFRGLPVT
jgi:hypothetical protein